MARRRSSKSNLTKRNRPRVGEGRRLHHETLEQRQLLAASLGLNAEGESLALSPDAPRLLSVSANSGELFRLQENNVLPVAPTELTLRFEGGQEIDPATFPAIQIIGAGGDGSFLEGNERIIEPGFLGFEEESNGRVIVARFAQTLQDDQYRVQIAGFDDPSEGIVGLRNTDDELFRPADVDDPDRPAQIVRFEVEVGAQVVSVVPQPIGFDASGNRVQHRNQIHVFFNEDPLSDPADGVIDTEGSDLSVVQPKFYNLFFTNDTVENTDDPPPFNPEKIEYDPELHRAVLTFDSDLAEFAPNQFGTFRLRIGSSQPLPDAPTIISEDLNGDVAGTFEDVFSLGANFGGGAESILIRGEIEPTVNSTVRWPGIDSPGTRDNRRDPQVTGQPDTTDGINVYYYNFGRIYGTDPFGNVLENVITDAQKQRTREVLGLYSDHLGVQFIESEDRGLQIVTGDLRSLVRTARTGRGEPLHEFRLNDEDPTEGMLVLDAVENWYDGYGLSPDDRPSWFGEALRGIGSLLGIGHTFDQVPGVASGSNPDLYDASLFGSLPSEFSIEPDFLSTSDIIAGQALHRPETRDVDLYRFDVSEEGRISIETFAERLDDTSLLDTDLKLWKRTGSSGPYVLVARNDDFFSNDSSIEIDVSPNADGTPAQYVIGITASGNDDYNPLIPGSGSGGRTEGRYEMRVTFQDKDVETIVDTAGTALDGSGDGNPGGDFSFWFRTAQPKGTAAAGAPRTLFVDKLGANNTAGGDLNAPFRTIAFAFAQAKPGDIVRILPSAGADGLLSTVEDNRAYEIGRGGPSNAVLSDGETFNVPQGVTVMVDAGTLFKLRNAKVSVGSERIDEDRSLAALQILGAPILVESDGSVVRTEGNVDRTAGQVLFTSYQDESIGVDTNPLQTSPSKGQWGGIEFRNDFDLTEGRPVWETEGIFLDYVSHADIRYGGGATATNRPVVNPLQMLEARPTLIYNTIRFSSDAAMSADPNSFEETNFHAPLFQRVEAFTSDYQRVGPDIRGNTLIDNSINGLFVRVRTPALGERTPMTVSGRFDDRDITHVLSETLVLQGQPGGPLLLEQRPDVLNVSLEAPATPPGEGTLPVGAEFDYRLTFITARGRESLASLPTRRETVGDSGSLNLTELPQAPADFAGRRLYRLDPATGDYVFVQQLDRNTTSFKDFGQTRGGVLSDAALAIGSDERLFPRFDARLRIDPGMVIKLDTARIEARFGADFYAEGLDGQPIVFTSPRDDTYGAGGTFDTNNDGSGVSPQPGDWSGLVFRQGSTASLDHTNVSYAGGNSTVAGRSVDFNPIEILQADVRIANSVFSDNASGNQGDLDFRDGVGFNGESTIFVRGAQPVIINNVIRDNLGAAISINPDALNYLEVQDRGRSTGRIARFAGGRDNQGPLIVGNQLDNNSINGLLVRNEALTTESVWDDTDIVHVVERFVYAWNHHHRSGLRLKSRPTEGLVVKLQDDGALVADRYLNDVEDSIGGTIQVLGQPGFPVVLTSIHDDTVGAGFTAGGLPQTDTDNANITPNPGDWHGIVIRAGANDRNVPFILETEPAIPAAASINAIPPTAQEVGSLATSESSADENRRLGFNIRGTLSQNSDIDVYSFTANGQTEIYLDIDDTNFGLDSIVELIDINGNILALSNDSFAESNNPGLVNNMAPGSVLPLFKTGRRIIEGPNPLDAGMRVILPGNSNTENQYFVRVRSSNLEPGEAADKLRDPGAVNQGRSRGQYQLSIRLRETDEIAGSTVRLADIRYATDAIDVPASPFDSPLAAEAAERLDANGLDEDTGTSFSNNNALHLGSLNDSHRRVLRVSGTLGNNSTNFESIAAGQDIDVFRVDLFDDDQEPNIIGENRFVSAIFDLDYADQLGRANTRLSIFDADGRMILHGLDSNVADDQGRPRRGTDTANLDGGSVGKLDSYIGPVELRVGTYYVVVSSAKMTSEALNQFFEVDPTDTNVRMLPINSVRRIAEDGFDYGTLDVNQFTEGFIDQDLNTTADIPNIVPLFDETSIVPYTLEDVRMFLTVAGGIPGATSTLVSVDPFTGQLERTIGAFGPAVRDLGMRRDGELFAYRTDQNNPAVTGNYLNISPINASILSATDSELRFQRNNEARDNNEGDPNAVFRVNAMAFVPQGATDGARDGNVPGIPGEERLIVVGDRSNGGRGGEVHPLLRDNVAYSMVAATGEATNLGSTTADDRDFGDSTIGESVGPASNKFELGIIDVGQFNDVNDDPDKTGGSITGLAQNQGLVGFSSVFGVTDQGALYSFDPDTRRIVDVAPTTAQGLYGGQYSRVINTTFHGTVERDPLHSGSGAPELSSITLGPRATEAGRYNNVFFATTTDGWIYTFQIDADSGVVEPAPVLVHGRSAVPILGALDELGASGTALNGSITGVAFSIREENPWHQTDARDGLGEAHGVFEPHDESRVRTEGGSSLYFGFDGVGLNNDDGETGNVAPGGSHGTTVSRPFSLEGISSADKPTVYFNYFLEVQGDSDYSLTRQQLDSFRVFAAGDDGQWQLVSTNDSFRSFSNFDEYDYFRGTDIPVQELHQNSDAWRQARVDLSPLAGNKNVQLRFDFSTAGGMQSQFRLSGYVTEIQAVPGTELADGSTFALRDSQAIPSGSPSTAFQFVRQTSIDLPDVEVLPNGRWPIYYFTEMSDVQVRQSIRRSLAAALGERDALTGMSRATADHYPGYGTNRIRVFEQTLLFNNSAVGFSTFLPGDEFGSFGSTEVSGNGTSGNLTRHGGLNNTAEGVYIDDIVVGFASRGEMVLNAPQNRNFTIDPMYRERTALTDDSQQPEFLDEILVGGYTLEVRGGAEYGVPDDYIPIRMELNEQYGLGRSFDVNDRLNAGAVSLIAPAGRDLLDGDTFVLSNGSQSLTFEFDSDGSVASGNVRVPFIPVMPGTSFDHLTDEPAVVARAIRDAINSSQARGVLGITAAGGDSRQVGEMTGNRVELFAAEQDHRIRVNPSSGRFLLVDMVAGETPYGRESARTLPIPDQENETVDQRIFFDTFARAVVTDYTNGQTDTLVATGKIGDPVGTDFIHHVLRRNPSRDEDILKIFLRDGDSIDVDLDAVGWNRGNEFTTPRLEIYRDRNNAAPVLVATSGSPSAAPGETNRGALISGFTASEDSNYFVLVRSSFAGASPFFNPEAFGEYQLTIRPAGHVARDVLMVDYHMDHGDTNVTRPQGQLIIEANFISHFAGVGIRATYSGDQLQSPSTSRLENQPGGVALLRNENSDRLVPGTVITNNVVHSGGGTGILFSGLDVDAGSPAPVPFGRIVNNTLVGSGSGTGINVINGASPTVLNNVVANFNVGLNIDNSSSSTEENFNTFQLPAQGNPTALSPQSRALRPQSAVVPAGESLFQDPDREIYIPAAGAPIIDNSLSQLNDRATFVDTVKQPMGIAPSPILAPQFDAFGIPRVADPTLSGSGGVGSNVFVDRGAIDRADFVQPVATLVTPTDFIGGQGGQNPDGDIDPSASFVRLPDDSEPLEFFEIQLLDPAGTGPDADTISAENVILMRDGVTLRPGVDYTFGYNDNNRLIRLTPLAGIWAPNAAYEITLNNRDRLSVAASGAVAIEDGDQWTVTDTSGVAATFEFDTGHLLEVPQVAGEDGEDLDGIADISDGIITYRRANGDEFRIELDSDGEEVAVPPADAVISYDETTTAADLASELAMAFANSSLGLSSARALQDGLLSIGGAAGDTLDVGATGLNRLGTPGVTGSLQLSLLPGSDSDSYIGETLTVSDGTQVITYEFTLDDGTETDNRPIILESGQTAATVTARLAQAIDVDFSSLSPEIQNGTSLLLNEPIGSFVDVSGSSQVSVSGVAGGAIPISVSPSVDFGRDLVAAQLLAAISASPLRTTAFFAGNGTLLLDHALSVVDQDGVELHGTVGGITDLAGNRLQPNRSNEETQFTILMPGNELDFGDAPPTYEQGSDGVLNPARHTLSDSRLPRLGQLVEPDAGNPFPASADDDDGLLIGSYEGTDGGITPGIFLDSDDSLLGFLNPHDTFGTELIVNVTGSGLLDGWVDFNQDGDWNDPGEQVFSNIAVLPGENRLRIQTPPSAADGETWMRLRLSPTGNQSPHGVVIGGEVEDYVVTVASVQLPVPTNDTYQVDEDTALQPADGVLSNDTLFGLLNPQVELESNVRFGTLDLELNADGEWEGGFSYKPDDDFYGTDTFTYRIRGEQRVDPNDPDSPLLPVRASQVGTVTITVNPVNDPPLVDDHEFTTLEDIEGGLRITAEQLLAGAAPGDFAATIRPPFDESAQSLRITGINDDPAVLEQLNDPPPVLDGDVEFTTTQGMTIIANFVDGALQFLVYFPTDDYNTNNPKGAPNDPFDSFTYTVYDDGVTVFDDLAETELDPPLRPEFSIGTVTLIVTPVNDPPTFTPGPDVTVDENSGPYEQPWAENISPGPADEVAEGQTVQFEVDIDPADLPLFDEPPTISDDGTLRFTPAFQANGTVPVDVRAIDSEGAVSETVTLTINITLVPSPPVARGDAGDAFATDEDTVLVLDQALVLANDSDPDLPNDELTIVLPNNTTLFGATVTLDASNNIIYDPTEAPTLQELTEGDQLVDTFEYFLRDRFGLESDPATISMSVDGVNDPPTAVDDRFFVPRDRPTLLDPLSNDFDIDGEIAPGTLQVVGQPGFGSVEVLADGRLRYTPFAGFPGSDQFSYIVEDTLGAPSAEAIVRIDASPLQNPRPGLQADVNNSGTVTPFDALLIINYLNSGRPTVITPDVLSSPPFVDNDGNQLIPPPFVDVDGNMRIQPLDALGVINVLNRQARAAQSGEGEAAPVSVEMSTEGGVSAALQSGSHDALGVFNDLEHRARGVQPAAGEGEAMPLDPLKTSTEDAVAQEIAPVLQADSVDKLVGLGNVRIETASSHDEVLELIARGPSDEDVDERTESIDDLWRHFDRIE